MSNYDTKSFDVQMTNSNNFKTLQNQQAACLISRFACEILEKQAGNGEFFHWIEAATSSTSHQTLVGRVWSRRRLNIFLGHDATPCSTSPSRIIGNRDNDRVKRRITLRLSFFGHEIYRSQVRKNDFTVALLSLRMKGQWIDDIFVENRAITAVTGI